MVEVLGYILVAVNPSPMGDVGGTAINYYRSNAECYYDAVELEKKQTQELGLCVWRL